MAPATPDEGRSRSRAEVRFDLVRSAELSEEELRSMLALLEREHTRWPWATIAAAPLDHLRWKSRGPDGEGLVIRGFEGRELVALMLAFFSRARLADREVARNHLNDSTTSSDHQGRGVSVPRHRIFASSERGRAPHLEITRAENPLAQRVMARRGFRAVACPIDIFVKVLDARRFAADWLDRRRLPGAPLALYAAGRMVRAAGFVRLPRPARLVYREVGLPAAAAVLRDPRARLDWSLGDTDEV